MPPHPNLAEIESAAALINSVVPPTPQISWPLLNARAGCELWVKHENHTAVGSFKIRGAVNYVSRLLVRDPQVRGIVAATRGNFGQSLAFAASRKGLTSTIVVPRGNSVEKNRSMHALGATLVEHGDDYQAAFVHSKRLSAEMGLHWVPAFHGDLVTGNAVSMVDFLRGAPTLDCVYIQIGTGTGVGALCAARDALGLATRIVGVASEQAPAIALSFNARHVVAHPATTRVADGLASSTPNPEALDLILAGVERVVTVSDDEVEASMRAYFSDTHNVSEGAAAAGLAAVLKECDKVAGLRIGTILSGGNIDAGAFARILTS